MGEWKKDAFINTFNNLDQVFTNLIKNAYESMKEGGQLEISTDFDDDKIMITFKDSGCGIPDSVLERLGTPFTTTKENGTGLGLSICREILGEYHATLNVKNTSPEGTVLEINFPLHRRLMQKREDKNVA